MTVVEQMNARLNALEIQRETEKQKALAAVHEWEDAADTALARMGESPEHPQELDKYSQEYSAAKLAYDIAQDRIRELMEKVNGKTPLVYVPEDETKQIVKDLCMELYKRNLKGAEELLELSRKAFAIQRRLLEENAAAAAALTRWKSEVDPSLGSVYTILPTLYPELVEDAAKESWYAVSAYREARDSKSERIAASIELMKLGKPV